MAHNIFIEHGNTSDGSLKLSDNGRTVADKKAEVHWHVRDSNIDSIVIKEKKGEPIWKDNPRRQENNKHWMGETSENARDNAEWNYSIIWTADNVEYTHDPIIAIKPTKPVA
jgi:hypothetical protein